MLKCRVCSVTTEDKKDSRQRRGYEDGPGDIESMYSGNEF